jgi:hypothetical protein
MLFIPLNVDSGVDGLLSFLSDKRAGTPPSTNYPEGWTNGS